MGFLKSQLADVIEWKEFREDMIFYKWHNSEIKKGSRLFIRPGQDAIFLYNGQIEGIFEDDGEYDIESQIVPFLSTLKGFKFGFNSGMRAEVLFINTKQFTVKWGTTNAINIPSPTLPGGLPIRCFGTYNFKVTDYVRLIEEVAGIKDTYCVEDIKLRITSMLDQLLMKWIISEGKDMFNLQANAFDISQGIMGDLNNNIGKLGMEITEFSIMSFSYPEEIQAMITKAASQSMIGDMNRYQQVAMVDSMTNNKNGGSNAGGIASDMAGMMMGMNMASQMVNQMNMMNQQSMMNNGMYNNGMQQGMNNGMQQQGMGTNLQTNAGIQPSANASGMPNFCPNCGSKTTGANFCPNCGHKLV